MLIRQPLLAKGTKAAGFGYRVLLSNHLVLAAFLAVFFKLFTGPKRGKCPHQPIFEIWFFHGKSVNSQTCLQGSTSQKNCSHKSTPTIIKRDFCESCFVQPVPCNNLVFKPKALGFRFNTRYKKSVLETSAQKSNKMSAIGNQKTIKMGSPNRTEVT